MENRNDLGLREIKIRVISKCQGADLLRTTYNAIEGIFPDATVTLTRHDIQNELFDFIVCIPDDNRYTDHNVLLFEHNVNLFLAEISKKIEIIYL